MAGVSPTSTPPPSTGSGPERLGPVLGFMRALWEVNHGLESASRRMRARLGVSGPERLVVRIVGEMPDVSPSELAEMMHLDRSSLSGLLERMVTRGLVSRRVDEHDARRSHLRLTSAGASVDRLRAGTVEAAVETLLETLPPRDIATVQVVLAALARNLEAIPVPKSRAAARRSRRPAPVARRRR